MWLPAHLTVCSLLALQEMITICRHLLDLNIPECQLITMQTLFEVSVSWWVSIGWVM